jgi:hypothetical protein
MPGLDAKIVCATNIIILADMIPHVMESNPLRMAREALGLSQEELTYLTYMALPLDADLCFKSELHIKATIVAIESGLYREPDRNIYWYPLSQVLRMGRLNTLNLSTQIEEWNKSFDATLAKEAELLTKTGGAQAGPK